MSLPVDCKSTSRAVERTLAIVEAFSRRDRMSCADVARRLLIPKTSAWYILRTLEDQGYLVRDPADQRYRLSMKMVSLGQSLTEKRIKRLAVPVLNWLKRQTNLSAGLANAGVVVHCPLPGMKPEDWIPPNGPQRSPCGKLALAYLPEPEVLQTLRERGMTGGGCSTLATQTCVMAELSRIREQGFTVDDETIPGLRFVAAPLFGTCGHLQGSIGVVGFTEQVHDKRLPQIVPAVTQSARMLMKQFQDPAQAPAETALLARTMQSCLPAV